MRDEWDSPELFPAVCPALARPLAHRGRLELVRDCEEHDVFGVYGQVFTELYRAIDGDVVPIAV